MVFKAASIHDWFEEALDASDRQFDTVQRRFQIYW